ncbi:MAG: PQQ-binding-like beta-propeller repeat protein [Planctomycetaceae bacterium]|nr:PQQ-binding-like beta-propeller repeat protein [Planctomycetaceae bacterium]
MIRRVVVVALLSFTCLAWTPLLAAESDRGGLISQSVAQQHGLERAWFTQASVLPQRGEVANLRLHVNLNKAQTIFRVTDQHGRNTVFSERHLDNFGQALGVAGAEKAAAEKVRLLGLEGIQASVDQQVVPDATLYMSSSSGMVQALDAETGRLLWSTQVGRPDYVTTEMATTDDLVALVNGQHIYVLQAADGALANERRVAGGAPAAGPAMVGTRLFVPTLSGQLHAYRFGPDDPGWPEVYPARGSVRFAPTAIGNHVMWATNAGVVTSIIPGKPGVRYRLQFDTAIAGPLVYAPPTHMLTVTDTGFLYCFDVLTSGLVWRFSSGDATAEPASVVRDTVYLVSRHAGMRAVDAATGQEKWWARGVRHFVAATKDRVYATSGNNVMMVINGSTGKTLSQFPMPPTNRLFVNNQTDRIYVSTESGLIQCLRERDAYWPTVHVTGAEMAAAEAAAEAATRPGAKQPEAAEPQPEDAQPFDPFRRETDDADPFAKPAATGQPPAAAPARNPFEDDDESDQAAPPDEADDAGDADDWTEADDEEDADSWTDADDEEDADDEAYADEADEADDEGP